jgi:hypothetical protein
MRQGSEKTLIAVKEKPLARAKRPAMPLDWGSLPVRVNLPAMLPEPGSLPVRVNLLAMLLDSGSPLVRVNLPAMRLDSGSLPVRVNLPAMPPGWPMAVSLPVKAMGSPPED